MCDYSANLDRILAMYEQTSKEEKYYLLLSSFKPINTEYELQCGLSPARTFSPVVIIQHHVAKIVCSTYEWTDLIAILLDLQKTFFRAVVPDSDDTETISNGDYMYIVKLTQNKVKKLMIVKHIHAIYLSVNDVNEILNINTTLLMHHIIMLDKLDFCSYYYNILDIIRTWLDSNKTTLSLFELLQGFCRGSPNCMLTHGFREYLMYYKDQIVNEFQC